jgi:hypothetical protein
MGNLSGITDGGWNADEEAKKGGFDPIPAGDYLVVVIGLADCRNEQGRVAMGNLSGITDGGWNADEEAKKGGFDPIPAGDYLVVVTASPIKQSKSSDGKYAAIEYQVALRRAEDFREP